MTPKYEAGNIFAQILRGEMPCVKVYEDDASLAFMDVMPRAEGHTLVIPKAPARTLFDLDPKALALFMPAVQKVGRAVMAGMGAEGLLLQQFNEPASGQQVFYAAGTNAKQDSFELSAAKKIALKIGVKAAPGPWS